MKVKYFYTYILLSTLTLVGVGGCRKDVEEFRPYDNSVARLRTLFAQVPDATTTTIFRLSASGQDTMLSTTSGIRLFLTDPNNLFADASGNPVTTSDCDNLQIQLTVLDKPGDIVATGLGTTSYPDGHLIQAGAFLRVEASCDGAPLYLSGDRTLKIQVPTASGQVQTPDRTLFKGQFQGDTLFKGWKNDGHPAFLATWDLPGGTTQPGYEMYPDSLGWATFGKPIDQPSTVEFCVTLPAGYTPQNTLVYLLSDDSSLIAQLQPTGFSPNVFCLKKAPVNYAVRIVSLSLIDDAFRTALHQTQVGSDVTVTLEPEMVSQQAFLDFIKKL